MEPGVTFEWQKNLNSLSQIILCLFPTAELLLDTLDSPP